VADIKLQCKQCGKELTVSEFATAESLTCAACGAAMTMPERSGEAVPLKLRLQEQESKTALTGQEMDVDVLARAVAARESESVLSGVHKSHTAVKKSTTIWLWLAMLIVGGGLVGWQYAVAKGMGPGEVTAWYETGRSLTTGLSVLLVLVVAFYDGPLQGVLSLLLPFYILYYAIVRMEFNLLRGFFLGVCVALVVEARVLPSRSLLLSAQGGFEELVGKVSHLIQRAGEPPGMPPKRKRGRSAKPKTLAPPPSIPSWPASPRR